MSRGLASTSGHAVLAELSGSPCKPPEDSSFYLRSDEGTLRPEKTTAGSCLARWRLSLSFRPPTSQEEGSVCHLAGHSVPGVGCGKVMGPPPARWVREVSLVLGPVSMVLTPSASQRLGAWRDHGPSGKTLLSNQAWPTAPRPRIADPGLTASVHHLPVLPLLTLTNVEVRLAPCLFISGGRSRPWCVWHRICIGRLGHPLWHPQS